jgi:hypothetical protein
MGTAIRSVLSIIFGAIVGVVLIGLIESISHRFFPFPPGFDPRKPEAVKAVMAHPPFLALLVVAIGWGVGALIGSWLAAKIAGQSRMVHAVIVGILLGIASVMTIAQIPHPTWFWVVGLLFLLVATLTGGRLGAGRAA